MSFYLDWHPRENESNNDTLLRPLLIAMLGAAGFTDVVNEANRRFDRHYKAVMASHQGDSNTTDIIPADLRIAIYSTVVRNGGEEVYEKLLSVSLFDELINLKYNNITTFVNK